MAKEDSKDFNAMLHNSKDMPKIETVTDSKTIERYGGNQMFFAPPLAYHELMKQIPEGKVITTSEIRDYLAQKNHADFTEPMTAGMFISIAAWASEQRETDKIPYWRTLKTDGELNQKFPGGIERQRKLLEAEGHTIIQKGRTNIKYYLENFADVLFDLY